MLSPYANSAVLASRAVKQAYKGLISELYAINGGQLSKVRSNIQTFDINNLNLCKLKLKLTFIFFPISDDEENVC